MHTFHVFCSRLGERNEDERTKEELEQIFHLLVDCTKVSTTPVNSSPLLSTTPIQPDDRSVTQSALNKSPTLTFVAPCPLPKPPTTIKPHVIS